MTRPSACWARSSAGVRRVRTVGRQRLDHDPEAAAAGGRGQAAQGLGQDRVAGDLLGRLAQDEGQDVAAATGQLAGRGVRVVAEPLGGRRGRAGGSRPGSSRRVRPFSTNDTVVRETPASVATSALVGRLGMRRLPLLLLDGASVDVVD